MKSDQKYQKHVPAKKWASKFFFFQPIVAKMWWAVGLISTNSCEILVNLFTKHSLIKFKLLQILSWKYQE